MQQAKARMAMVDGFVLRQNRFTNNTCGHQGYAVYTHTSSGSIFTGFHSFSYLLTIVLRHNSAYAMGGFTIASCPKAIPSGNKRSRFIYGFGLKSISPM